MHDDEPLIGHMVGSWRVARLLGAGGMGRVYEAVQPSIGGRVAVKVLSRECAADRDLVDRFFAEARAVNLIRHEHIVHVLDLALLPDGRPYIVMDYIDGASLAAVIAHRGALPLGGLVRLVIEVLDAIGAAHERGVVHRDLKPDNVFVTPAGHARVLDFGIAKLAPDLARRSGPTRSGMLLGTPTYMSPEQATGRTIDARTDLYAIGVMLYEGATGTVPFDAPVLYELLRQHIEEPPPPPRARRPEIPPELEAVILRAMAKQPDDRFASAAEMATALRRVLDVVPASDLSPAGAGVGAIDAGAVSPVPPTRISDVDKRLATTAIESTERTPARRSRAMWIVVGAIAAAVAAGGFAIVMWKGRPASKPDAATAPATATAPDAGTTTSTSTSTGVDASIVAQIPIPTPTPIPIPKSEPRTPNPASRPTPPAAKPDAGPTLTTTTTTTTGSLPPLTPPADPSVLPRSIQLEPPSPTAFDAGAYYATALSTARRLLDDAELVLYYVDNAKPSGLSDLTTGGSASYTFRSRSRSSDPPARCLVNIVIVAHTVQVVEGASDDCDEAIIGAPRCLPADIWKRAQTDGAPEKAVANVMLLWWRGRKIWHFRAKDFFKEYQDDC